MFEELGFYYVGPIDGHNMDHLLPVLRNLREADDRGPVLLHVITQKGRGYAPAEASGDKYPCGQQVQRCHRRADQGAAGAADLYQSVFSQGLLAAAEADSRRSSPSPQRCRRAPVWRNSPKRFPDRFFDVGIAEQHAVTFAAGLASEGLRPFCAIYSTFLQRAYDQVVHDVVLQNLAGALRHRPRRSGRRGRRHPCRLIRPQLSRLSA